MPEMYAAHHSGHDEPRDRSLRAGDGDREAVAELLRKQHLAGRLETDEFQDRLGRCYAAKTYAQLDDLLADLPSDRPIRPAARASWWPVVGILPLLIAALALAGGHLFWLAIPLLFFVGRPLLWRSTGRRIGWGFTSCGAPRGTYV